VAYSPLKASTPSIPRTSWANEMPARLILTPPGAVLPGEIVWRIPDPAIAAPQADLWRDCRGAEAGAIPGISVSTVRWPWRRPYGGVMEVRLFGELEALTGGVPVPVRGAKQRTLLALLALQRGQPVSAGRLIDLLWDSGQAANPANALQTQISQLRRTLGPAAILTTEAGYALAVGPGEVDVVRFEQLVATGRRLAADGELAPASATLAEALRLRRGEPLAEFTNAAFFDAERAHLDELTLLAIESRAGADLGLGHYGELAGELEALCWEHPLRERLRELHIRALYQSGLAGTPGPHPGSGPVDRPSQRPGRAGSVGRPARGSWQLREAGPPARDEVVRPALAAWSGAAPAAQRAAGPRDRVEADPHLRARWFRQDDAAHRVAGGGTGQAGR
jgi:DNA-binding SARP family transcriptional activator